MLTRHREALLRSLYTRHGRKKSGMCVVEGLRCCRELFAAAPELVEFTLATPELIEAEKIPGEVIALTADEIEKFGATCSSQGILSVARQPKPAVGAPETPFILLLDRLGDPGNFGTVLRTARAANLECVWYTKGSVDPYGDKAIRSALGAQFSMRLSAFDDLASAFDAAREYGYNKHFITDPHAGESCYATGDLYAKSVVVIGGEANGVEAEAPGTRVTIPMPGGFESLNAAQAATIFIFEYVRRIMEGK